LQEKRVALKGGGLDCREGKDGEDETKMKPVEKVGFSQNVLINALNKLFPNSFEVHKGRPGEVGGSLPRGAGGGATEKDYSPGSKAILDLLKSHPDGFSYRPMDASVPQDGYMSSVKDGPIFSPDLPDAEALAQIDSFLSDNADLLNGSNIYVGGWLYDGQFYLDASGNFKGLNETMSVAASSHQKGVFDLNTYNTIFVGEWLEANPDFDVPASTREWYRANPP